MNRLIELVSDELGVPTALVEDALNLAFTKFKKIKVPKRAGGFRVIVQPAVELKLIHYWLNTRIFSSLPISNVASAFFPSASILKNAITHKHALYAVRIDLSNFFPSIRTVDLNRIVETNSHILPLGITIDDFEDFSRRACFDRNGLLPIGYPTSPHIANVVMYDFDNELRRIVNEDVTLFGHVQVTRYADDFVFSTDKRGACHRFVDTIRELIAQTQSPRLEINVAKTRYMSRRGGSMLVTGLRINQDCDVRVHATYRDHIRLLLKHFSAGKLDPEDRQKLVGHLAYVEHVDPRLFTRLSYKYHKEIARLRGQ